MTWKGPLSEEEYEVIISHFKKNRPEIASDPEKVRAEVAKLDEEIIRLQGIDDDDRFRAVSIMLQARNPLARMIGDPEVPWPAEEGKEASEAIEAKHVAVLVASGGPLLKAFNQSLGLFKEKLRFFCYDKMSELLDSLLAGKLCGIIAIQMDKQGSIEGFIRHDLKNRSGWDYKRAQAFVLPPCKDFFMPHMLLEITATILQMQSGQFALPEEGEEFDLEKSLPALTTLMRIPQLGLTRIVVIDDTPSEVESIRTILRSWNNLHSFYVDPREGLDVEMTSRECEIILLDEAMGEELTGTQVRAELVKHGFKGVIASITGGEKPEWAKEYFARKSSINSFCSAQAFIRFINRLISQVEG